MSQCDLTVEKTQYACWWREKRSLFVWLLLPPLHLPARRAVRAFPRLPYYNRIVVPVHFPCSTSPATHSFPQQCGSNYASLQQFNKAVLRSNSTVPCQSPFPLPACINHILPPRYNPHPSTLTRITSPRLALNQLTRIDPTSNSSLPSPVHSPVR